jgi:hypothetical protein
MGLGWLKRAAIDLLKGITASIFSFIGLGMAGMIAAGMGMPSTSSPAQADMRILIPLMLISGALIAILLGECFRNLYSRYWERLVSIWLCTYLLYYLLNTLDGLLFSPLPNLSTSIFSNLFPALFAAAAIAWLWRPSVGSLPPEGGLSIYLSCWKPRQLVWRMAVAWLSYPPIYYVVGRGAALFTMRYYQDPSLGLGLTLPPIGIMLAMQVLRGALFLLAIMPIVIVGHGSPRRLWLWVGAIIFCQIAANLIIEAYWLPAGLRIPHAFELLIDSATQAWIYVRLLAAPVRLDQKLHRQGRASLDASGPHEPVEDRPFGGDQKSCSQCAKTVHQPA